jgi:hypothetical protein
MSEHVWKIGDWCEYGIEAVERFYVFNVDHGDCVGVWAVSKNGVKTISPFSSNVNLRHLKHLPDCTGWDWQPTPKLQLREGAWYERADGKIVGPCSPGLETIPKWTFKVGSVFYDEEGNQVNRNPMLAIIREVPVPAPKYRPFVNAAEFRPHRDRWIRDKSSCAVRVTSLNDNGANGSSWWSLVKNYTFEDTNTPVGVEVTELEPNPATP